MTNVDDRFGTDERPPGRDAQRGQALSSLTTEFARIMDGSFVVTNQDGRPLHASDTACELVAGSGGDFEAAWARCWSELRRAQDAASRGAGDDASTSPCDGPVAEASWMHGGRQIGIELYDIDADEGSSSAEEPRFVALLLDRSAAQSLLARLQLGRRAITEVKRQGIALHASKNALAGLGAAAANLADELESSGTLTESELARLAHDARRIADSAFQSGHRIDGRTKHAAPPSTERSLTELLRDVVDRVRPHAARAGVRVDLGTVASGLVPHDRADGLSEALYHLVENSIEASSEGDVVVVEGVKTKVQDWVLRVLDRGTGVAPEHLGRMRRIGFSTKGRGRGFGLFTARLAARSAAARVRVSRRRGGGTVAEIRCGAFPVGGAQ